MKERPILFSAPMIRAILDGSKTQTRRIIKPQPMMYEGKLMHHKRGPVWESGLPYISRHGKRGDHLWVRETWQENTPPSGAIYRADEHSKYHVGKWRPSIFMPREYSRITLEITDIRVQRLQDISDEDCIAEGIESVSQLGILRACGWKDYSGKTVGSLSPKDSYKSLWESLNGAGSWSRDPFVWAISFRRV